MRLVRIGPAGEERPAVLPDDGIPLLGRPGGTDLRAGDTLRLEIDGLGAQQQTLGTA